MPTPEQQKYRRKFLQLACGLVGVGVVRKTLSREKQCKNPTPAQTEGPFYPVSKTSDTDWDLTHLTGNSQIARGNVIWVEGIVQDQHCQPVENSVVEIWQACASGRYNHPADHSGNPLDSNFQYWGIINTDSKGHYAFQTILPGHYRVTESWTRPPHIHFKVHKRGFQELTTQLYFRDHPLNKDDLILKRIPESKRIEVVRPLVPIPSSAGVLHSVIAKKRIVFNMQIEAVS